MGKENTVSMAGADADDAAIQEPKTVARRNAKDSVFCDLFGNPRYLLQLYQALHPEDRDATEADLGNVTIRNVLLDRMYNDLGFTVGNRLLILVESQSTFTVNIVIRCLMYLASTWQEYIEGHKYNVYGSRKLEMPRPELYMIFTGERKGRPEVLSLRDEFFPNAEDMAVDVRVKVLYDGAEGDIINQYVTFAKIYDGQVKKLGRTREAVLETIRICRDRNVLAEYLSNRGKEVVDIMMTLFDQEYAVERYADEREATGKMNAKRETAYELKNMGLPIDKIAQAVKVSLVTIQQWFAERPAAAK